MDPENITTSAGDVFVRTVFSLAELPIVTFLNNPTAVDAIPEMSPLSYERSALNNPCAASLARLGSFKTPYKAVSKGTKNNNRESAYYIPESNIHMEDPTLYLNDTNQKWLLTVFLQVEDEHFTKNVCVSW